MKNISRRFLYFGLLIVALAAALVIGLRWNYAHRRWPYPRMQRLQEYGKIKQGARFPKFTAYESWGEVTSTKPAGKFHIHVYGNAGNCFDQGCGKNGHIALARGGHLYASTNPELADRVGLEMLQFMNKSEFVDTMMFVIDSNGTTVALYRYASLDDVLDVLTELRY